VREVGREVTDDGRVPPARSLRSALSQPLPSFTLDPFAGSSSTRPGATRASPRRRRRPRLLSRHLVKAMAAAAATVAAIVFTTLTDGGRDMRSAGTAARDLDAALAWAGFGLDQVSVEGHRFTPDGDILDALDLTAATTWRSFDGAAARARVERLPWVATASLVRRFPGRLEVRVTERQPYAVWQHGARETLISRDGRVLADIRPGTGGSHHPDLPRFKGEGADSEAAALMAIVARHPELMRRLVVSERVAGRRWTLHLDSGTALVLPPDREALVLENLDASARLRRIVDAPGRIVDLRAAGRVSYRPNPAPMAARPQPRLANGGP
jgi:cell division protein FtsQ